MSTTDINDVEITIPERPDSAGDLYVKPLGYIKDLVACESLAQLVRNFESAFPFENCRKESLLAAIKFTATFLMEICDTCPGSKMAEAAARIGQIIVEDDLIATSEQLAAMRRDKKASDIRANETVIRFGQRGY